LNVQSHGRVTWGSVVTGCSRTTIRGSRSVRSATNLG
jgi:hypothetical protein